MDKVQNYWQEQLKYEQERTERFFQKSRVLASVEGYLSSVSANEYNHFSDEVVEFAKELLQHIEVTKKRVESEV